MTEYIIGSILVSFIVLLYLSDEVDDTKRRSAVWAFYFFATAMVVVGQMIGYVKDFGLCMIVVFLLSLALRFGWNFFKK